MICPAVTVAGSSPRSSAVSARRSLFGEPVGLQPEQRQGREQGVAALLSRLQPGDAGDIPPRPWRHQL